MERDEEEVRKLGPLFVANNWLENIDFYSSL